MNNVVQYDLFNLCLVISKNVQTAFSDAIQQCTYKGAYRGVFPVKCNHDRDVLHAVLEFGRF